MAGFFVGQAVLTAKGVKAMKRYLVTSHQSLATKRAAFTSTAQHRLKITWDTGF